MKCLVAITASLLLGFASTIVHGQENSDELLGAIAGGVIGSTIGSGDGQTIATILGVIIGADIANNRNNAKKFAAYCKTKVPLEYRNNSGATKSWIQGCVAKLQELQSELESKAYEEAYNGLTNK